MAKRTFHGIFFPSALWQCPDLDWMEKVVLMEIFSYQSSSGTNIGTTTIASDLNIPTKDVKAIIKSLYNKGALELNVDEDGAKSMVALIYKTDYKQLDRPPMYGDKPTDATPLDWEEIAQQWTNINPTLKPINRWTPARKRKLKGAMKQAGLNEKDLIKVFKIISVTPFLSGLSDQFKAEFDWICTSDKLSKIYEGFYSRSYQEKRDYENIMRGQEKLAKNEDEEFILK